MTSEVEKLFLKSVPSEILLLLFSGDDEQYALKMSRKLDITYSHTVKVLQKMQDHDLVEFQHHDRKKLIFLTPYGVEAAEALLEFRDVLNEGTATLMTA
jgi:DNA-binding MarR family transcriptional regulator